MANKHQKRRRNRKAKQQAAKAEERALKQAAQNAAAEPPAPRLSYLQRFIQEKLQLETEPFEVDIGRQGQPLLTAKQCHPNCEKIVAAAPFWEARTCWIIHDHTTINGTIAYLRDSGRMSQDEYDNYPKARQNDYEAEFHSILRNTRNGAWYDPTADLLPSCTSRTVVLEPRMSTADWSTYVKQAIENPATDRWISKTPIDPEQAKPDFFELLQEINTMKTVLASGGSVLWL